MDMQAWRLRVLDGQMSIARRDLGLRYIDKQGAVAAQWTLDSAWPSTLNVVVAPGGTSAEEVVGITANAVNRVAP